eukprot:308678-Chlamydomonas_euryale.AAC.2
MMQLEEENSKMRQGLGGAGAVTFARMSGMSRASGGSRVAGVAGLDADPYASGLSERELAMGAEIRRLQEELAAKSKVERGGGASEVGQLERRGTPWDAGVHLLIQAELAGRSQAGTR